MTNIIKQILGEDIPGSTDADVTADEFLDSGPRTIDHGNGVVQAFDCNGDERWYRNGVLHRDNDLPAVVWANGTQIWYHDDAIDRGNDLPAVIWNNGAKEWYRNGKRHRDGGPAAIYSDGYQAWYKNDKRIK